MENGKLSITPKQILTTPVFLISTVLLITHQVLQKLLLINLPLIDAYLDDFLAMPFILSLFLAEQLFWKRRTTNLTLFEIGLFTTVFAIFFEEIIPSYNTNYTKDSLDYVMYVLGSLFFQFTINNRFDKEEVNS